MARVRVRAVVEFESEIPEGPEYTDGYGGAETLEERITEEAKYFEEGSYLVEAMSFLPCTIKAEITPVED